MTRAPAANNSDAAARASGWPDDPFWTYSLAVYPRLREPALALQDQSGADVNIMLFCCWAAASGRGQLTRPEMAAALAAVRPWQRDVVQPLRSARRFVTDWRAPDEDSGYAGALRAGLLDSELAAERVEHILLSAAVTRPAQPLPAADAARNGLANLRLYVDMAGLLLDIDGQKALNDVWRAAFA